MHHQDSLNDNNGSSMNNPVGQLSPQANISFEMIDEEDDDETLQNGYPFGNKHDNYLFNDLSSSSPPPTASTQQQQPLQSTQISTSKLQSTTTTDNYKFNSFADIKLQSDDSDMYIDNYTSDLDYYPMRSSPGSSNVVEPEREDFPVNNAQPPDYAPKLDQLTKNSATKTKFNLQIQQRRAAAATENTQTSRSSSSSSMITPSSQRKLSSIASVSTHDLHRIDDSVSVTRKPIARSGSPVRSYNTAYNKIKKSDTTAQLNKENNIRNNRRITVQIMAPPMKPPARSKTSIDLRGTPTTTGPTSGPTTPVSPISNQVHLLSYFI